MTFQNGYEAFAEYRRTGFPVFTQINTNPAGDPIDRSAFPNRLAYPSNEVQLNGTNYNAAVAQQGADVASTKIWWETF